MAKVCANTSPEFVTQDLDVNNHARSKYWWTVLSSLPQSYYATAAVQSPRVEHDSESDIESFEGELINDPDYDLQKDSDMSDSDSADLDDDVIL